MLRLTAHQLRQIREHSQTTYPREGCGILIGSIEDRVKRVTQVQTPHNQQSANAERRYLIPADAVRAAQDSARSGGLEIVGFFHSHPNVAAIPSEFDRHHAWPWYSYLIVSVHNGQCREHHCWTLRDDRSGFEPEELQVVA